MRFVLSLMAGLILVGAAPLAAAEAAPSISSASSAASAGQPARAEFGAGPASATKLDGRPFFTYDAQPGGTLVDHIAIENFAAKALKLNVYTADAHNAANGDFAYGTELAARRQVGAWLTVSGKSSGQITVPARTTVILPFRLDVPRNASPGDHAGAVIVSINGLVQGKGHKLTLEQRIATRVIIRVSGPVHPQLSIEDLHARFAGHLNPLANGTVTVSYTVRNTGNALLGASQKVTAHGLLGATARSPALPAIPLLLPGGAVTVKTQLTGLPPEISVTATVRLNPQGLRGDLNPGLRVTTATVTLWTIPWLLALVVVILLVVIIALIWRRRRRSAAFGRTDVTKSPQGVKS
jgi:Bacterial protein of unknown function (DUF916)